MPDTLPNIPLPANTWVDLYAASGIAVGTQLLVVNNGVYDARIVVKATQPTDSDGWDPLARYQYLTNTSGDSGVWAICIGGDGQLNVKVA